MLTVTVVYDGPTFVFYSLPEHTLSTISDTWPRAAASLCRGNPASKLWFTHRSRQSNFTSSYNPGTIYAVLPVWLLNTAELSFSWRVHTWAQFHQVRQLLGRQGAAAVFSHPFIIHLSSLPALIVWRSLLQLEHQSSWHTAQWQHYILMVAPALSSQEAREGGQHAV